MRRHISVKERTLVRSRWNFLSATKVPFPGRRTTSPRWDSSSRALRTVTRLTPYRPHSWCSVGSWLPGGYSPARRALRSSSASCWNRGVALVVSRAMAILLPCLLMAGVLS